MEKNQLSPSLQNILEQKSLQWVIVAGEGGAGKTICSSVLAILLSKVRQKVLIIEFNDFGELTNVFGQSFSNYPAKVEKFDNLYAMEVGEAECFADDDFWDRRLSNFLQDFPEISSEILKLLETFPGYSEFICFAEILKVLKSETFSIIIFVCGTYERTSRFLALPRLFENGIEKLLNIKPQFSTLVSRIANLFGFQDLSYDEDIIPLVKNMNKQFQDSNQTTVVVVCVCNIDNLMTETEVFLRKLKESEIDSHNIIINRVLPVLPENSCNMCGDHTKSQQIYMERISDMYQDFHITKLPLFENKARGTVDIVEVAEYLGESLNVK